MFGFIVFQTLFVTVSNKFISIGDKNIINAAAIRFKNVFWAFFISSSPEKTAFVKSIIQSAINIIGTAILMTFITLFILSTSSSPSKSSQSFIGGLGCGGSGIS